jgi:hypothetical protein
VELGDQFRKGYTSGLDAARRDSDKRPFWYRLAFVTVLMFGGRLTNDWLAHHTSLGLVLRIPLALAVAVLLGVAASVVLDRLLAVSRS